MLDSVWASLEVNCSNMIADRPRCRSFFFSHLLYFSFSAVEMGWVPYVLESFFNMWFFSILSVIQIMSLIHHRILSSLSFSVDIYINRQYAWRSQQVKNIAESLQSPLNFLVFSVEVAQNLLFIIMKQDAQRHLVWNRNHIPMFLYSTEYE